MKTMNTSTTINCPSCGAPAEIGTTKCSYCNAPITTRSKMPFGGKTTDIEELIAKRRFQDAMKASATLLKDNPEDSTLWLYYIESLINGCSTDNFQYAAMIHCLDSLLFFIKRNQLFIVFEDSQKVISLMERVMKLAQAGTWKLYNEKNTFDFNDLSVVFETIFKTVHGETRSQSNGQSNSISFKISTSSKQQYINNVLVSETIQEPVSTQIATPIHVDRNGLGLNILILIRLKFHFANLLDSQYQKECLEIELPKNAAYQLEKLKNNPFYKKIELLSAIYQPPKTEKPSLTPSIIVTLVLAALLILISIGSMTFVLIIPTLPVVAIIFIRLFNGNKLSRGLNNLLSALGYIFSFFTLLLFIPHFFVDKYLNKMTSFKQPLSNGKEYTEMVQAFQQGTLPLDEFLFLLY